jgi:hypothetical protein
VVVEVVIEERGLSFESFSGERTIDEKKEKERKNSSSHLEHPRLEVGVEHEVDPEQLPVTRAVRVLAAPPPGVLEVAVGGVGAGQEHVRGDVAEIGPELVEGLRVA